jgi:hypothetical protein
MVCTGSTTQIPTKRPAFPIARPCLQRGQEHFSTPREMFIKGAPSQVTILALITYCKKGRPFNMRLQELL